MIIKIFKFHWAKVQLYPTESKPFAIFFIYINIVFIDSKNKSL